MIYIFLHQTIHIKKEKGLTVQLISYSVHGKSMFFDAHPVLPVSQQWIHMYILLLLFWSPLLLWSRLSWLKFFFCYFLPPGLLHKSDETTLWWSERLFRNRGRVPKLILLMIFLCNWNTRAHVCIYFKIMRCPGAYDQKV